MYCYKHENQDTVASCACGRGLCNPCSERFAPMGCEKCALESVRSLRREIYKDFAITVALFALGYLVVENGGGLHPSRYAGLWPGFILGYLYAGIRAGWLTIGKLGPRQSTLAVPIFLWFGIQFLKLLAAALIGVFMLPVRIVQNAISLKNVTTFEYQLSFTDYSGPKLVHPCP